MEASQSSAELCGTATHWGNSQPGKLLQLLASNKFCNPVLMLDEIDKTAVLHNVGGGIYDPLSALYQLLEPATATTFYDQSFTLSPLNASGVIWLMTSNIADLLPAPILSRVKVFKISRPTPDQVAQIAKKIYNKLITENQWGKHFDGELKDAVINMLSNIPPREIRNLMLLAFGKAATDERSYIMATDFPARKDLTRRIGFLH